MRAKQSGMIFALAIAASLADVTSAFAACRADGPSGPPGSPCNPIINAPVTQPQQQSTPQVYNAPAPVYNSAPSSGGGKDWGAAAGAISNGLGGMIDIMQQSERRQQRDREEAATAARNASIGSANAAIDRSKFLFGRGDYDGALNEMRNANSYLPGDTTILNNIRIIEAAKQEAALERARQARAADDRKRQALNNPFLNGNGSSGNAGNNPFATSAKPVKTSSNNPFEFTDGSTATAYNNDPWSKPNRSARRSDSISEISAQCRKSSNPSICDLLEKELKHKRAGSPKSPITQRDAYLQAAEIYREHGMDVQAEELEKQAKLLESSSAALVKPRQ